MTEDQFKQNIGRAFIMACCLEPLAEKRGCTTRFVDSSPGTKLEYFIVSAANSVAPLLTLVDRILAEGKQPNCVFDAGYLAQLASTRNRGGGKVNYAQILMFLPVIVGQCLLYLKGRWPCEPDELFTRVTEAMGATTTLDVSYLQKLVDLSTAQSIEHHRRRGTSRTQLYPIFSGENILEAVNVEAFSHTMMATEIRDGYPVCRRVYRAFQNSDEVGLIRKSESVYEEFLPELRRSDITADCIAVAFYMMILQGKDDVLFP